VLLDSAAPLTEAEDTAVGREMASKMNALEHCTWASYCTIDVRKQLAEIAVEASLKDGDFLVGPKGMNLHGESFKLPSASMLLVTKGVVDLVTAVNGHRQVMDSKSAGFTAGEAELITQHTMEYAVRAKAQCTVLHFDVTKLTAMLRSQQNNQLLEAMWSDIGEGIVLSQLTNQDFFKVQRIVSRQCVVCSAKCAVCLVHGA
jgi:hypothetical protein